jgi:alkylhydroperoxidase family enzyme
MPRVTYVAADLAEPRDIVDAVRARRGGELRPLDRLLLHSPELTRGWNTYLAAVRTRLTVDARSRELAICAVAILNRAEYEYFHHAPIFLREGGTQAQLDALRQHDGAPPASAPFDARDRAILDLTREMTRHVEVGAGTFAAARAQMPGDQAMVELVGIIATYNMVSRFLVALDLQH